MLKLKSGQVERLAGLTKRQLSYWASTGLAIPGEGDNKVDRGKSRMWNYVDVVGLRAIRQLLAEGLSLQKVRQILPELRRWTGESNNLAALAQSRLVVVGDGARVDMVTECGQLESLWPECGQLFLFDLRETVLDVQKRIREERMDDVEQELRRSGAWVLEDVA